MRTHTRQTRVEAPFDCTDAFVVVINYDGDRKNEKRKTKTAGKKQKSRCDGKVSRDKSAFSFLSTRLGRLRCIKVFPASPPHAFPLSPPSLPFPFPGRGAPSPLQCRGGRQGVRTRVATPKLRHSRNRNFAIVTRSSVLLYKCICVRLARVYGKIEKKNFPIKLFHIIEP